MANDRSWGCDLKRVSTEQVEDTIANALGELLGDEQECTIESMRLEDGNLNGGKATIRLTVKRPFRTTLGATLDKMGGRKAI